MWIAKYSTAVVAVALIFVLLSLLAEAASYINTTVPSNPNLTNGLVGHWTMDGNKVNWATGTVIDSSGMGNNGTVVNMATSTSISAGKIGQALKFDGTNDFVNVGDISSYFSNQEATYSAWVRRTNNTPSSITQTGSWFFNTSNANNHYVWTDGNIYDGSFKTTRTTVGAGIVTDRTQWHFVTITRKAGANGWKFYQNATEIASDDGGTWEIGTSVKIGQSDSTSYNFFGLIDDVRIYNRALSASEITRLYQLGN